MLWISAWMACSGPALNPDAGSITLVHHTAAGPVDMTMDAAQKQALAACLASSQPSSLGQRSKMFLEDGSYDVTFLDGTHARVVVIATSTHIDDGDRTWANECALPLVRAAKPVVPPAQ